MYAVMASEAVLVQFDDMRTHVRRAFPSCGLLSKQGATSVL